MRFDDLLDTVRAADLSTPAAVSAAWRQIVDLAARGRIADNGWLTDILTDLKPRVPLATRAASARALMGTHPPAGLVRLLATDDIAVAAPVLRTAALPVDAWRDLLPRLTPTGRAVLRHRRDLPHETGVALASFGAVDFVIGDATPAGETAEERPAPMVGPEPVTMAPDTGPFVAVGQVALGLPVVAEALRRENDNEAPAPADGTFRIADVVARLEAFQRRQERVLDVAAAGTRVSADDAFQFETDEAGLIRWVEGVDRATAVGVSIARPAQPGAAGVDGAAAGAFRRRARIADARLELEPGRSPADLWLVTAVPAFDPASGRFVGYGGAARRPRPDERADAGGAISADALRQLVHELRTPTNAIAGFSEMIEREMLGPVAAPHRDQAAAMRRDADALLAAIDDLDTVARIDTGALSLRAERIGLATVLARVAADLAPLADLRGARLVLPATDAVLRADLRAVERLAGRLLGTLLGAAGPGEALAIAVADAGGDRVMLTVDRPVALRVLASDALFLIDDEDSPATLLGMGFALRLVRNLAREMGGRFAVDERSVSLVLPAVADDGATPRATSN